MNLPLFWPKIERKNIHVGFCFRNFYNFHEIRIKICFWDDLVYCTTHTPVMWPYSSSRLASEILTLFFQICTKHIVLTNMWLRPILYGRQEIVMNKIF